MDADAAHSLLQKVLALGCTHFDTAEGYQKAGAPIFNEEVLGAFFQKLPRETFTVATKYAPEMHNGSCRFDKVANALDASLLRLGLSHVDIYYVHNMPETVEHLEEWMRSAQELVAAGKVRHVGLSGLAQAGDRAEAWLRRAHAVHPVSCVQHEWSVNARSIELSLLAACKELGITIVAHSPLARELLASEPTPQHRVSAAKLGEVAQRKDVAASQLALAWLYRQGQSLGVDVVAIPGTTKFENASQNFEALAIDLGEAELAELNSLAPPVDVAAGQKVDAQGNYLRFPGVTVVCNVPEAFITSLAHLPDIVRGLDGVGGKLAPLPATSYHVTLLDVCCQYKMNMTDAAWTELLQKDLWAEMVSVLEDAKFTPQLQFAGTSFFNAGPGKAAIGIEFDSKGCEETKDKLVGRLNDVLRPVFGDPKKHWPWHMTLCYVRNSPECEGSIDEQTTKAVCQVLDIAIHKVLDGGCLPLNTAKLCRFDDMTLFSPWDPRRPFA